ncbi:MAG TPA: hypothetical protein VM241_02305 [Candidatus Thermoplasmatota archaeon]|nr:hypothetical protein [Candidatus Thermoplasmatota archaeon]
MSHATSNGRLLAASLACLFLGALPATANDIHEQGLGASSWDYIKDAGQPTEHSLGTGFITDNTYAAQKVHHVAIYLQRIGSPENTCVVLAIRAVYTGPDLTFKCVPASNIPTTVNWVDFVLDTPLPITPGGTYFLYARYYGSCDTCIKMFWNNGNSYRDANWPTTKYGQDGTSFWQASNTDVTFLLAVDHSPLMVTDAATAITNAGATLNGRNTDDSGTIPNTYYDYGTSTLYGQRTPSSTCPQSSTTPCPRTVTGLQASTLYHFRICGDNTVGGLQCGSDRSFTTAAVPAPANDAFASATTITDAASQFQYVYSIHESTAGATLQGSENTACGASPGVFTRSVWFRFVPKHTGKARISTWGSDYNTVLAAYTGTSLPTNTAGQVACSNDSAGSLQSHLEFTCVMGQEYRIQVGGVGSAAGTLLLQASGCLDFYMDPVAAPRNPYCVESALEKKRFDVLYVHPNDMPDLYAQRLPRIREQIQEANGFLHQEGLMPEAGGRNVDYRVKCTLGVIDVADVAANIPSTGDLPAELTRLGYNDVDLKYVIWYEKRDDCGFGSAIGAPGYPPTTDELYPNAPVNGGTGGTTWAWVNCDESSHGAGDFLHEIGHALGAVKASATHHDVPFSGHCADKRSALCDDNYAYTTCSALRYDCGFDDYFNLNPHPGDYLFTHWNQGHRYNKFLQFGPAPANDNFASRTAVASGFTQTLSTTDASHEAAGVPSVYATEPTSAACGQQTNTVWYQFTAPRAGTLSVNTAGSSFDTTLAVFTGSALDALTLKACNNNAPGVTTSAVSLAATSGTTYQIQAGGSNGATGSLHFQLTFT